LNLALQIVAGVLVTLRHSRRGTRCTALAAAAG
jgi:hypothetical protein